MRKKLAPGTFALSAVAALAAAITPALAAAQSCNLLALQKAPCDLVAADVVAKSLGVAPGSLKAEDNLSIMGKMPHLTSCIYNLPGGSEVRIGQIASSSAAAFDSRYRQQSEAEISSGMGAGVRQAEKAVGRPIVGAEKSSATSMAADMVRGMQYEPVAGLGEKATVMYSGKSPNAHLITLVKDQTFVVMARISKAPREKNLEAAKPIAAAIAARCR